jgi:hypothetical protein
LTGPSRLLVVFFSCSREIFRLDRENFTFEAKILSRIVSIIIVNISGLFRAAALHSTDSIVIRLLLILHHHRKIINCLERFCFPFIRLPNGNVKVEHCAKRKILRQSTCCIASAVFLAFLFSNRTIIRRQK